MRTGRSPQLPDFDPVLSIGFWCQPEIDARIVKILNIIKKRLRWDLAIFLALFMFLMVGDRPVASSGCYG